MPEIKSPRSEVVLLGRARSSMMVVAYLIIVATQQDSILLNKAGGFPIVSVILIVGVSIESEHNNKILRENERIGWAAVLERTFLCRMDMTRS
jgi:hypothetical protein